MKKIPYTKAAWITSVCLLILLAVLGTGATIAWFTDTPAVDRNTFQVGTMDLKVSYKNDQVTDYTAMDGNTAVFNDQALYEPGYTQVVYLKIENDGNVSFDYKLSVDMNSYTDGVNVYGETLHLPDHLRFGVVFGASEAELDRALARENAVNQMESYCLDTYSQLDTVSVAAGEVRYAALVVFMPEEVDNVANGRGEAPSVELGVGVYAQQAGTPMA
ncbi:MAG: SipW-dependent-type signal peptide-containing protein [Oscillospiraceae bacterium]|nr:SipW-dependent-type signal peptide-containing protein [Oscillospiraceae bacterium]